MGERTTPGNKVALTIGVSDSSGTTGVQVDLKVFAVMDVFGTSALTAVTAQNTTGGKHALVLDVEMVRWQIETVADDVRVDAVKTGDLCNAALIETVARTIKQVNLFPLVVDPAMSPGPGGKPLDDAGVAALVRRLLPLAAVVTATREEAARLLGLSKPVEDLYGATEAARQVCTRLGARACVVKGIKVPDNQEGQAVDVYFDGKEARQVASEWRPTGNTRGAGGTFSAALTAALARGQAVDQAVQTAKNVVAEAIRQTTDLGHGAPPVNPLAYAKVKK